MYIVKPAFDALENEKDADRAIGKTKTLGKKMYGECVCVYNSLVLRVVSTMCAFVIGCVADAPFGGKLRFPMLYNVVSVEPVARAICRSSGQLW